MPDLSDVEAGIVGIIAAALYSTVLIDNHGNPVLDSVTGEPVLVTNGANYLSGAVQGTVAGITAKCYRGWPESTALDADLAAGKAHVSVFPASGASRDTTRMLATWQTLTATAPTVTWTVSGATATLGGTAAAGNIVGLRVGPGPSAPVYGARFGYADTLASVAAELAGMIPGASASGATVTLPTPVFAARVGMDQCAGLEVRRQEQVIIVSCWCPTPAARDALCSVVDLALANATTFPLADGWSCYLRYRGTWVDDKPSKARVWRRDMRYSAEYPTVQRAVQPEMLFLAENVTADQTPVITFTQ